MVAPLIAGAGIAAGGALLGGMLGSRSARKQQAEALSQQREFAQHGIRWRVEDAKAAGLHPLYALGAATSGPSFSVMEDPMGRAIGDMGQHVGRAVQAQETSEQTATRLASLEVMQSQAYKNRMEGDAAFMSAASEKARLQQAINASPGIPSVVSSSPQAEFGGSVQYLPNSILSRDWSDPSLTAGQKPGWDRLEVDPGAFLTVFPQTDISEMFENPVTGLWALNKTLQQDPEFFKKSSFPFGKLYYELSEALWNKRLEYQRRMEQFGEIQRANERARRWFQMRGRGISRARSER